VQFARRFFRWFAIALILAALCTLLAELLVYASGQMVRPPLKALENQLVDLSFQIRLRNDAHQLVTTDQVVIVDIDDASIERLGRPQSWPRAYDARAIAHVGAGNPSAIGIDYLYTEPDTLPGAYAELLSKEGVADPGRVLSALRTDDELAEAIGQAGVVYLAYFSEDNVKASLDSLPESLPLLFGDKASARRIPFLDKPVLPVNEFTQQARAVGAISMPTMLDGSVRHYQLLQRISAQDGVYPYTANFPLFMLLDQFGLPYDQVQVTADGVELAEGAVIPLSDEGAFRINWLGSEEEIRAISFYKVLNGLIPAEYFEGKYVFFGTSASGMQDLKTVPCRSEKMPGVEVHAIAFLNMINAAFIREYSERESLPWFFLAALLITGIFLLIRPLFSFLLTILLLFGQMTGFVLYFMPEYQAVFPVVTLMILTILCYIFSSLFIYFVRERKNRLLKSAFASYVPRDVVDKIARDASAVKLGGEKKMLTVLFSDIRGFTSYSEKMDPQDLVAVLNNYLSKMSEAIFRHKGTIDKFIGDAIMAIFGAPIEQPDHASRACEVALDMIAMLQEVNQDQADRGQPPLHIGIGLNTGEMTVGNIGSQKRFDYTVIGDAVNLGSRLEGLTKMFGVDIIISEMTFESCDRTRFVFRELGEVIVKGKDRPVRMYQLICRKGEPPAFDLGLPVWENAFNALRGKQLNQARPLFEEYLSLHPEDVAALHYIQLCDEYASRPEEFTVVLKMESK
jgi:adenylate cyclase